MHLTVPNAWVDTHLHIFGADVAVAGARYVPHYSARLEDWLPLAQQVGVTRGVCVQPSFLGQDNSLMVSALTLHPTQLRGVAVLSAQASAAQLNTLHDAGVRGLRLNLSGVSHDIPEWTHADVLWQTMHALGWHLELHTDRGALPEVLAQLPSDLPLVLDHMAKPLQAQTSDATIGALVARSQHAPTHIKLSGAYRLGDLDAMQLAKLWLQALGPSALLWGSDWPCTNHEHQACYADLFLQLQHWVGDAHLEQVLSLNPQRVYGFGSPAL